MVKSLPAMQLSQVPSMDQEGPLVEEWQPTPVFLPGSICFQLCPTLCDCMKCRPPGSCIHGISQARILQWAAISFSKGSSLPRDETHIAGEFFTAKPPGKPAIAWLRFSSVQLLSCVQLCNLMDCSTPGFPVHHQLLELAQTHVH